MFRKKLLFLGLIFLFSGCAQPVPTKHLIDRQESTSCNKSFDIVFRDDRDSRFKNEKIIIDMGFPVARENIIGDLVYDTPLNIVFEKMVAKRFGINKKGLKAEFKLKALYTSFKYNDLVGVPFVGLLAVGSDVKWKGTLRVDIAILDNQNKFILNKTYDEQLVEMHPPNEKNTSLEIIHKLFAKFSANLESDIERTRFPENYSSIFKNFSAK